MQCDCTTEPGSISNRFAGIGGKRCTRKATYMDRHGRYFCTQHAKEPPTIRKKASGKIRADLIRIEPYPADHQQRLAMQLAYHCVRNPLEDLHVDGRISDAEMQELMIEITDRIYTAIVDSSTIEGRIPAYWQVPKLVEKVVDVVDESV